MPCYAPLKGFRSLDGVEKGGKPRISFNPIKAINSAHAMVLPCGQCIGCRMDRVEQWGLRCMHEAQMHEHNSFLTLTYDDEHLPADYSIRKPVFQKFMKRLRFDLLSKIRFYACGEYGDQNGRPHYHALIFGWDFHADRKLIKRTEFGNLYTSEQASKAWPYGNIWIGDVTYKSASYVAGYVSKKITGEAAPTHYLRLHPKGYLCQVEPEFQLQSQGIGRDWFAKYKTDAFPSDFCVVEGRQVAVPRYYLNKLKEGETETPAPQGRVLRHASSAPSAKITRKRKLRAASPKAKWNNSPERLKVRETIRKDRLKLLKREL